MFRKILGVFLTSGFGILLSGCAAIGGGIGYAIAESEAEKFKGAVEVGDIKIKAVADVDHVRSAISTATVSSTVFKKDMMEPNIAARPSDMKVNAVVAEETKRSLGVSSLPSSLVIVRIKTFYFDEGYPWGYYYWGGVTEKDTLSYYQKTSVRKAINAHFTVEKGSDVLLEVHGLWGGNDNADEIAGARQLAREVSSKVIEKLSATPPQPTVAEKQ
jgi:hypothetical protein